MMLLRDACDSGQGEGGGRWLDSRFLLKAQLTGFVGQQLVWTGLLVTNSNYFSLSNHIHTHTHTHTHIGLAKISFVNPESSFSVNTERNFWPTQ